ncbi:MAG: hypothetical protein SGI97_07610 [candidate division Zixibacteria bacterium]|nr:hypothetical protein [candidate division Zixibacteria bacterium]
MKRLIIRVIGTLAILAGIASAQEVVIKDFPLGVGGSIDSDHFQAYFPGMKAVADTLKKYPLARAVITGGADGGQYQSDHDAKNPGLALGRAHILRALLISEFKVDSIQIIVQSDDSKRRGSEYRYASIRISRELSDIEARLQAVEQRAPVEKHFTEVQTSSGTPIENFGLQFGAGLTTSPFGGIPLVNAALTWERVIFVEAFAGHTFWNSTFNFDGSDLNTKRRLIGGQVIVFPISHIPVGIVGGWIRIEEISQSYYKYVNLSEGPLLGLRVTPIKYLSATGVFDPAKRRIVGEELSKMNRDQFLLSITAHIGFGGAK